MLKNKDYILCLLFYSIVYHYKAPHHAITSTLVEHCNNYALDTVMSIVGILLLQCYPHHSTTTTLVIGTSQLLCVMHYSISQTGWALKFADNQMRNKNIMHSKQYHNQEVLSSTHQTILGRTKTWFQ